MHKSPARVAGSELRGYEGRRLGMVVADPVVVVVGVVNGIYGSQND